MQGRGALGSASITEARFALTYCYGISPSICSCLRSFLFAAGPVAECQAQHVLVLKLSSLEFLGTVQPCSNVQGSRDSKGPAASTQLRCNMMQLLVAVPGKMRSSARALSSRDAPACEMEPVPRRRLAGPASLFKMMRSSHAGFQQRRKEDVPLVVAKTYCRGGGVCQRGVPT